MSNRRQYYFVFKWNSFVCSFQRHKDCCVFHRTDEELVTAIAKLEKIDNRHFKMSIHDVWMIKLP